MKKALKYIGYFFIGLMILAFIGGFIDEPVENQEIKKINEPIDLKEYKALSKEQRDEVITQTIKKNNWDISLKNDYVNCMGDFAYSKSEQLAYGEVIQWCKNEKEKNLRRFHSHINELEVRKNGNYNIGYDKNIALLKKQKLEEATKIAIKKQENSLIGKNIPVKKVRTPAQALKEFGGLYTVKEISKNEVILYTTYYQNQDEYITLEEAKRNFIDGVFQAFIYTDVEYITISIILQENQTKKQHRFSFKGMIKRKDALKVAQELLNIKSFSDLVKVEKAGDYQYTTYNAIANRARYNDTGNPTLNVFFEKLVKTN